MIKLLNILKEIISENEDIFITGTVNGLENLRGKVPLGFKDRRSTYSQSSEDVYYTEDLVDDKKIFSIVDRRTADDFGRPGFISISISTDKNSNVTLDNVRVKLQLILTRLKSGGAIDKNTGKIDKYKLNTIEL